MKLIDLLVRELPKRGGWPDGAVECQRFVDEATIYFYDENGNWDDDCSLTYGAIAAELVRKQVVPCGYDQVTFDEYQSALAASRKVEWSGDGLPPVGCECEFISNYTSWGIVKIIGIDGDKVVFKPSGDAYYGIVPHERQIFRPLRSEADKKRDAAAKEMARHANNDEHRVFDAGLRNCLSIYDAIAAGKIPGVKLED